MAELMRMPEVAAGATSAILSEWLVGEGDSVAVGDPIAIIETDKAEVEIEAETAAVILKLLVTGASQVDVGSPMALLGRSEEAGTDVETLLQELGVGTAVVAQPAPPRREIPEAPDTRPEPDKISLSTTSVEGKTNSSAELRNDTGGNVRRFISPIARRMLRDSGVDGSSIAGTGPGGRIIRNDVLSAIAAAATTAPDVDTATETQAVTSSPQSRSRAMDSSETEDGYTRIPHSRLRQAVARRLTSSKQTVPHFYLKRQAVIDELLTLRKELNSRTNKRLSVNDFVLRAVAYAHIEVPQANAIWTDDAIRQYDSADIAVAIASDRGLVTPVLHSVEAMSLGTISTQVRAFVSQANDGKLRQDDLEGGSITVTNLGMYGVDEFSAIINPPHSAILAVGAGKAQPVVVDGHVETATVMSLVLSVDHRAIDGALAAKWMEALVAGLENPLTLLV